MIVRLLHWLGLLCPHGRWGRCGTCAVLEEPIQRVPKR